MYIAKRRERYHGGEGVMTMPTYEDEQVVLLWLFQCRTGLNLFGWHSVGIIWSRIGRVG